MLIQTRGFGPRWSNNIAAPGANGLRKKTLAPGFNFKLHGMWGFLFLYIYGTVALLRGCALKP